MNRTDPLASLIDYVLTVKPYHTKIYEVLLEYRYQEAIKASVSERYHIYTTITTPESDKWFICDNIGWDVPPYDIGLWDYPDECNMANPSKILAKITDKLNIFVDMFPAPELAFTYVQDHTMPFGWDTIRYDHAEWDSAGIDNWLQTTDNADDAAGATITESLTITVT